MFLILRLADGGVMFERSAPRVRLFKSATLTNKRTSMRSNWIKGVLNAASLGGDGDRRAMRAL
jgi:hypothetical protein